MKILLYLFLVLLSANSTAQNIEITVLKKNSQPVPYAYILINKKPVEVCDSSGLAKIPSHIVHINDTISISYLGAAGKSIIFDESASKTKRLCFNIDESVYELDEVVVAYQNVKRLFNKSVRIIPLLNYDCIMSATLHAKIDNYIGTGTIEATNKRELPRYWNWFNPPIKFVTNSDTNKIWYSLNHQIHLALNLSNLSLWRWQNDKKTKPIYSYLGSQGSNKIFRIVYPKNFITDFYYHIIVYVDKDTKYIKSVEVEAFNDDPNGNLHKFTLDYDCVLYTHKKPKKETIYLPDNIRFNYQIINGRQWNLEISNISIKT